MFQVMIRVVMNLKSYAENQGNKIIIHFVLMGLKGGNKEDTVYVMKTKTHIEKAFLKRSLFENI